MEYHDFFQVRQEPVIVMCRKCGKAYWMAEMPENEIVKWGMVEIPVTNENGGDTLSWCTLPTPEHPF